MKKWLFLWVMGCTCGLFSQNEITTQVAQLSQMKNDSLKVKHYHKIAESYVSKDTSKTVFYLRKSLELAQKIHWNDGIAQSHLLVGEHYRLSYHYEKAASNFKLALSKTKNKTIQANTYFSIGQVYLEESNYTKALATFHQSLQLFETTKDKNGIIKVLLSMGSLYTGLGKNKEALDTYNRALKISKEASNFKQEIIVRGIGTVYYNYGDTKKSLAYLEKSLSLIKLKKDANLESRLLSDIALVYLETEDYKKAIDYSQASLKTAPSILSKKDNTSFSYGVIGDSYIELAKEQKSNPKLIDSAIFYLEKAAKLHRELNSLRGLYDDYESIYEAQKLKENYAKALEYFELCTIYKDSMYNSDNKETIKNLEDKRAIELRDREIKINKLTMEAKEKQKGFLIAGLALLGIIGSLLLYQNQIRKKTNEKLQLLNANLDQKNLDLDQANKTNARFFGILNHDLRRPVYNLIHFLQLQKESPELLDAETQQSIQSTTMVAAENLLRSMEDMLLWSKGQMENFQPQMTNVAIAAIFEDTRNHFLSEEKVQLTFESAPNLYLNTDENYLKTILRNLTGNAINALDSFTPRNDGETSSIIWNAWQENDITILTITDNGKGASDEQFKALYDDKEVIGIKSGLGLHLIRDLAKAIHCDISVDSKADKGTTFTLRFK